MVGPHFSLVTLFPFIGLQDRLMQTQAEAKKDAEKRSKVEDGAPQSTESLKETIDLFLKIAKKVGWGSVSIPTE